MWKPVQSLISCLRSRNHLPNLYPYIQSHKTLGSIRPSEYSIRLETIKKNYIQPDLISYARFVKRLYPSSGSTSVDHDELYDAYRALPEPRPYHLRPQDVNTFIDVFLERRDFVKPNQLDGYLLKSPKKLVRLFEAMMRVRHNYIAQTKAILSEFQQYDLALTAAEKTRFLYYYFYKDKKQVVDRITEAKEQYKNAKSTLDYNEFNIKVTNALLKDEKQIDIETINMLLFHSSRHNQEDVIELLVGSIEKNHKSNDKNKYVPNNETFKRLLDHYGQQAVNPGQFSRWISTLVSSGATIDIHVVNSIIKGLLNIGELSLAEDLLTQVFVLRDNKTSGNHEDVQVDKQLSYDDVKKYKMLISQVNDNQFQIYPSCSTFLPFIEYYCNTPGVHNSFSKVWYLMDLMHNEYNLPVRTRSFIHIFGRFGKVHNDWELQEFNLLLTKLLDLHQDTNNNRFLKLSGQLNVQVVNAFLQALSSLEDEVTKEYTASILEEQEGYFNLLRASKEFHSRGRSSTKGYITKQATIVHSNLLRNVLMRAKAIALRQE